MGKTHIEHSPLDLVSNGNPRFCWLTTCDEEHSLYEEHCTSQSHKKLTYSLTEFKKPYDFYAIMQ